MLQNGCLYPVTDLYRYSLGGNEVEPASGVGDLWRNSQDRIGDRVQMFEIKKKLSVKCFLPDGLLDTDQIEH